MTDALASAKQLNAQIGNELKLLWAQLDAYQELFGVEQEKRSKLVAATAPGCFSIFLVSLVDSMLMRVFRLMDRAKTAEHSNCAFAALAEALSRDSSHASLSAAIKAVRAEWKLADGPYAGLERLRNKDLSHNDASTLAERNEDQLWMTLKMSDFHAAQALAGRLWHLYKWANRSLHGSDVVEPQHERLEDRPAMRLKHLSASRYLDTMLGDDRWQHQAAINAFEEAEMGEDRVRPVFVVAGDRA